MSFFQMMSVSIIYISTGFTLGCIDACLCNGNDTLSSVKGNLQLSHPTYKLLPFLLKRKFLFKVHSTLETAALLNFLQKLKKAADVAYAWHESWNESILSTEIASSFLPSSNVMFFRCWLPSLSGDCMYTFT